MNFDFRHAGLSIRNCLQSGVGNAMARCIVDHSGQSMTADQLFKALVDELQAGREVLPIGDVCDNWDFKTGCRGHSDIGSDRTERTDRTNETLTEKLDSICKTIGPGGIDEAAVMECHGAEPPKRRKRAS